MKKALLLALLFLTPIAALGMLKYDIQQGGAYSLITLYHLTVRNS